ncbi:hypothetical protein A3849_23400 [Paenibacillus sp. P46E]|nr:hypothetical protein A3849_23400 [Paenibacillus sp. P46E]
MERKKFTAFAEELHIEAIPRSYKHLGNPFLAILFALFEGRYSIIGIVNLSGLIYLVNSMKRYGGRARSSCRNRWAVLLKTTKGIRQNIYIRTRKGREFCRTILKKLSVSRLPNK